MDPKKYDLAKGRTAINKRHPDRLVAMIQQQHTTLQIREELERHRKRQEADS